MGLRVDWWIDERRDPEKSTDAAIKIMSRLYKRPLVPRLGWVQWWTR